MGIDPSSPEMTFLLVMLHTGTMFAVMAYFWRSWRQDYFESLAAFWNALRELAIATLGTAIVGGTLLVLIEKMILRRMPHAEVEALFGNLTLIAISLAAVGVLILVAGRGRRKEPRSMASSPPARPNLKQATWIGAVQGLCLPFRGFSRSGATISTAMLVGVARFTAEKFSFALAVILTPPVILRELLRLFRAHTTESAGASWTSLLAPGLLGAACSFLAGLLALRWISRWLERGRWHWFGFYCLGAAIAVFLLGQVLR